MNPYIFKFKMFLYDLFQFYLLIWYCVLTAFTVIYVVLLTHSTSVSTSTRKLFHVIIVAVYFPGLWLNAMFLLVASLIAFCVIFAIEVSSVMVEIYFYGKESLGSILQLCVKCGSCYHRKNPNKDAIHLPVMSQRWSL